MVRLPQLWVGVALLACARGLAQLPAGRIAGRIDETRVVTLEGNVHPLAQAEFDQGPVSAEMRLERMILLLEPSPGSKRSWMRWWRRSRTPSRRSFHHWLTPAEYAAHFGVSAQDVERIAGWLTGHGFTVEETQAGGRLMIFSGTRGRWRRRFTPRCTAIAWTV